MSYMTFVEQITSHLQFLLSNGLDVNELNINSGFIRCRAQKQSEGRGELCYKTTQSILNNGMIGLATWCRCPGGIIKTHRTYGVSQPEKSISNKIVLGIDDDRQQEIEAVEKSKLFWEYSDHVGESDYLRKKGVGYYGIRFRNNSYGRVAVIPLRDVKGELRSYQLLNSDGVKRMPKNTKVSGLFHILQPFVNGQPIGISESYVVAATCYETVGIPAVAAISSSNLEQVAMILRSKYPNSRMIILGDNDRHLEENKGVKAAYSTNERLGSNCTVAIPDFVGFPIGREYSDWNDLVRIKGGQEVRNILTKLIRS